MIFLVSKNVENNAEPLKHAAEKSEKMEYRVEIADVLFLSDIVDQRSDGIRDPTAEKQGKAIGSEHLEYLHDRKNYRPTDADVTDHAEAAEAVHIDCGECYGNGGKPPDHRKSDVGVDGVSVCKAAEKYGRVGPGDQKIYSAMVNDSQDALCSLCPETVIDAGDRVCQDHRESENPARSDRNGVTVRNGIIKTGKERYQSEDSPGSV